MFQCSVCDLTVNSNEQLQQHLGGKTHKKKLRAAGFNEDGTPIVTDSSDTAQEVDNSTVGKKRKSTEGSEAGMCSLCNIVFNSTVQAQQHYNGSKHFKKMKIVQGEHGEDQPVKEGQTNKGAASMLYCGFCKIQVNSMEQLEIHRQGAKHRKKFEAMKCVPVTYPGHNFVKSRDTQDQTSLKADDVPKTLPSFESYISTSNVKPESTEFSMPSLDSYLKG